MVKFIQLSDLHIHKDNDKEDNLDCMKVVGYIINRYSVDKPIVLLTGDIVDDGAKDQYKNAVKILQLLVDNGFTVLATREIMIMVLPVIFIPKNLKSTSKNIFYANP